MRTRIVPVALATAALLAVAACSSSSSSTGGSTASSASASTTAGTSTQAPLTVVTLSFSNPPQQVGTTGPSISGYIPDLLKAAAKIMNRQLTWVPLDFATGITSVEAGKYDIEMFINGNATRYQTFDVASLYIDRFGLVALASEKLNITKPSQLCGLSIGYVIGGSYAAGIQKFSSDCTSSGKPAIKSVVLATNAATTLALKSGRINLQVQDTGVAAIQQKTDPTLVPQSMTFYPTLSGIGVKKGSPLAQEFVNAFNQLIKNGTYAQILSQYDVSGVAVTQSALDPPPLNSLTYSN